jgi:integrase/recombinase XerD
MQETRRFKPSTVSRRTSLVTGFYRTCVIDGVLDHSPAEYVRRPTVPAESLTLGLTHPQFEAMLTVARESTNCNDFALIAMLGLLGLRIFEAAGSNVEDLGEEHGHRVLRVVGKGTKAVLVPLPPAVGRAIDRAVEHRATGPILRNAHGVAHRTCTRPDPVARARHGRRIRGARPRLVRATCRIGHCTEASFGASMSHSAVQDMTWLQVANDPEATLSRRAVHRWKNR